LSVDVHADISSKVRSTTWPGIRVRVKVRVRVRVKVRVRVRS
jgi:hypothetical protein